MTIEIYASIQWTDQKLLMTQLLWAVELNIYQVDRPSAVAPGMVVPSANDPRDLSIQNLQKLLRI